MLLGLLFCAAFVAFSFLAREQPGNTYVLVKADKLVRTAGASFLPKSTLAHRSNGTGSHISDY